MATFPIWLQGAAAPRAIMRHLFICLFAALVRTHYSDIVPEGTRISTGNYRKHRNGQSEALRWRYTIR